MNKEEILKLAGFSDEFIKSLNEFSRDVAEIPVHEFSSGDEAITVSDSGALIIDRSLILATSNMIVRCGTASA